uniref:Uncharacterized protein n=1 Tax=Musca domestica TaxID=7370 RepID=A0A1I8MF32_MUSDO
MSNGKCIRIECPEGTMWTGSRCSLPEPITHNITINNKINTISEASRPNININYTNNLQVNAPVTINQEESNNSTDCEDDTVPTSPPRCCTVVTPRTCKKTYNRWHCYHTRNQMCGDFCEASTIYLRPPRPYSRPNLVIVPPCDTPNGQCGLMTGGYDCSGCAYGNGLGCPSYCNRYKCVPPRCAFCDQQTYCRQNFGSFGCSEDDGCFDSWCS